MIKRILSRKQILSLVDLKQQMTWSQISEKLGVPVSTLKHYGKRLKAEGYIITKQPAVEPIDLTQK